MKQYVLTEDVSCLREVGNEFSDIGCASQGEIFVRAEEAQARIAELKAEALSLQKCCRDGLEMLNTIGRQLGGQIPEQLVSEVAQQRMDRIAELEAELASRPLTMAAAQKLYDRIELRNKDARIAELQEELDTWIHTNAIDVLQRRIAELEKQAAIDKTLLALADARINRELRDDFAGRAMPVVFREDCNYPAAASSAYQIADAMLKAKGGA